MTKKIITFVLYCVLTCILSIIGRKITDLFILNEGFKNYFFSISFIHNRGAAFGIFEGGSFILGIIGIIAIFVIAFFVLDKLEYCKNKSEIFLLSLISSGILENTLQRFLEGKVFDFIKLFPAINFLPSFNVYDVYICVGAFFYLLLVLDDECRTKI